jgi:hypothetical protein
MRVTVAGVEDFLERVRPAAVEVHRLTDPAERLLEIELAAGDYRGANLSIGDADWRDPIDLIVRGTDQQDPPVLRDTRLAVAGRRIRLQRLVFVGHVDRSCVLSASASQTLAIDGCAFLNNQVRGPGGGGLIELFGGSPLGTHVSFGRCWFMRNLVPDGDALVWCAAEPPRFFTELRLNRVVFLDNRASTCLLPNTTVAVTATSCLVVPPDGQQQRFATRASPGTIESIDPNVMMPPTAIGATLIEQWHVEAERGDLPDIARLRTALS